MRLPAARAIGTYRRVAALATACLLGTLAVVPALAVAPGSARTVGAVGGAVPAAVFPLQPVVLWNGANVSSHGSPASAIPVAAGQTANVTFGCTTGPLHATCPVSNASLTLTFLGIAVTTSQSPFSGGHGENATINWSFGSLSQLTEGVYELKAVMLNGTGGDVWSESFFIDVKAPFDRLESGLTVFLIILALAEIYAIVGAIRGARRPRRRPSGGKEAGTPPAATESPAPGVVSTAPAPSTDTPPGEAEPPPPPSDGGGS